MGLPYYLARKGSQEARETPPAEEGLVVPDESLLALLGHSSDSEELPGG